MEAVIVTEAETEAIKSAVCLFLTVFTLQLASPGQLDSTEYDKAATFLGIGSTPAPAYTPCRVLQDKGTSE